MTFAIGVKHAVGKLMMSVYVCWRSKKRCDCSILLQ